MEAGTARHLRNRRRPALGFTLIELMIALAIVAILLSIGVPAYREHVRRAAIAEALEALASGRVVAEQFFLDNRTYNDGAGNAAPCPAATQHFAIACVFNAADYTITATGSGPVDGFVFDIDETNARTTAGPWGSHACWISRKGDDC